MPLNPDSREFIELLLSEGVDFLVVGGVALAAHGRPRYTGDINFWIRCDSAMGERMERVVRKFGFASTGLKASDFGTADQVIQLGVAPHRIDILTGLSGLVFSEAWEKRVHFTLDGLTVPFLDRESLRANKRATGRPQDMADLETLDEIAGEKIPQSQ
jgi:hypothetical protein